MDVKPLNISIVAGDVSHAEAVFDDLRTRACGALDAAGWLVQLTIIHVGDTEGSPTPEIPGTLLVPIPASGPGPAQRLFHKLAAKPGLVGILGRLLRDNLESRRVARSLFRHQDIVGAVQGSAVVVSADPSADRAVWLLRHQTGAHLVHGPIAMVHAIKVLTAG